MLNDEKSEVGKDSGLNLNLFAPAYLSVSEDLGGGHVSAPLCFLGSVWVGVPILFGNDLSGRYLPYSKGLIKFG